jgi:hypothetical protein
MKKLFLLALVIAVGFTACEEPNDPSGSENICTITFDANGGAGGPDPVTIKAGEPLPALDPENKPDKELYIFTGYCDTRTGDGTWYYNGDLAAGNIPWDKTEDITLYAQWTEIPLAAISFNANGGSGGQTATVNASYGQPMPALAAQVPINEDSSDGYAKYYFDGYWDAQSGGKKYYNADLTSASDWDKTADAELFARWLTAAQKYNITLGADDFTAYFVETPPVIDGSGDDAAWAKAKWQDINYAWMYNNPMSSSGTVNTDGTVTKTADFSGRFKVVWTADRLYILVEIIDDIIYTPYGSTPMTSPEKNDCLELFIDENASGGGRTSGGNNFFTYHMNFDGLNAVDYVNGTGNVLRNSHLNYRIDKNDVTHTYIWETEMKVYDSSYPLNTTPDNTPVTLTDGKKMGFVAAYCDNDNNAHSNNQTQIANRDHFIGSMFVTGNTDDARNVAYRDSTQYAKLYLVK